MADKSTFIKVDRNIMHWRWYQDANTTRVFLHLLLKANIEPHDFEKTTIPRGSLATSSYSLSRDLHISRQSVRTAISHLILTGEITTKKYPRYQVISIVNYDKYQKLTTKSTSDQPASNHQLTTNQPQSKNKRSKEGKNEKNIYSRPPSVAEVEAYAKSEGLTINAQDFVDYNDARGWAGIKDWRPLVRFRARQTEPEKPAEDDGLDVWGKPIKKEFETI